MRRDVGTGGNKTLKGWVVATVLVLCCMSGLATGVLARSLSGQTPPSATSLTSSGAPHSTAPASRPTHTPVVTSSPTTTQAIVQATGFSFTVAASPAQVAPGQPFTVTVSVLSSSQSPLAGIQCFMRAPSDGSPSLFQDMPTPQVSNANGQAIWNLTAPQVTPGTYRIEVIAYGSHSFTYYAYAHLVVTNS